MPRSDRDQLVEPGEVVGDGAGVAVAERPEVAVERCRRAGRSPRRAASSARRRSNRARRLGGARWRQKATCTAKVRSSAAGSAQQLEQVGLAGLGDAVDLLGRGRRWAPSERRARKAASSPASEPDDGTGVGAGVGAASTALTRPGLLEPGQGRIQRAERHGAAGARAARRAACAARSRGGRGRGGGRGWRGRAWGGAVQAVEG